VGNPAGVQVLPRTYARPAILQGSRRPAGGCRLGRREQRGRGHAEYQGAAAGGAAAERVPESHPVGRGGDRPGARADRCRERPRDGRGDRPCMASRRCALSPGMGSRTPTPRWSRPSLRGSAPRLPALLLALAIPLAWLILQATSLGNAVLPVMYAFGILGRRLASGSAVANPGRRGPSVLVVCQRVQPRLGLARAWFAELDPYVLAPYVGASLAAGDVVEPRTSPRPRPGQMTTFTGTLQRLFSRAAAVLVVPVIATLLRSGAS
jgi:hypothetical protein